LDLVVVDIDTAEDTDVVLAMEEDEDTVMVLDLDMLLIMDTKIEW
jgi:hypothetical protein